MESVMKVRIKKQNPRDTRKGRRAAKNKNRIRVQKSRELDQQLAEAFAALHS